MNRKIIIREKVLDKEICSFLTQIGADIPINWSSNALAFVRDAVIEAYAKIEITLEVDECLPVHSLLSGKRIWEKKGPWLIHVEKSDKR